jgi:phosphoadenosine phosphosulfate reductase
MNPMHERMVADGITLIIRGQKDDDTYKSPLRSGAVVDGVELLFPIEDWTQSDVMSYLTQKGVPIPRFYRHMDSAPDCMTCSAWWENGAAKYLKKYHPEAHREVQARLDIINEAVGVHIAAFNIEVNT